MNPAPWTFEQAQQHASQARDAQRQAEQFIIDAARDYAAKERAYRIALARRITEFHAEGVAWSSTSDLARGDEQVAMLKFERDVGEGVREAATQASWRAAGYRREVELHATWSMRRELAEGGGHGPQPDWSSEPVIGRRAAA
jgi:hypothetical protein